MSETRNNYVKPFRISVEDAAVDDLNRRLDTTRWPAQVDAGWSEGTDPDYLRSLLAYWRQGFDWRERAELLNDFPQVLVEIDDTKIHAVHRTGNGPDPLPLLMSHGWPSTFAEWQWVVDALADPEAHGGDRADSFHVVAPSLPGYGFSSISRRPGTSPRRIAGMWVELMTKLGYGRFAAHGCDWGSYVTALLALDYPDRVIGAHMGMVSLGASSQQGRRNPDEEAYVSRVRGWREEEHGYVALQGTKPATLAYGLNDSPSGLAAWIAEKWRAWSDCDGDPDAVIHRDDLLTAISIYWFSGSIGTASRLYRESRVAPVRLADGEKVTVPCGFLLERPGGATDRDDFLGVPRIGAPPRERAERAFNIHRWTLVDKGGHFPALETPEVFVDEVRAFFRPLRDASH